MSKEKPWALFYFRCPLNEQTYYINFEKRSYVVINVDIIDDKNIRLLQRKEKQKNDSLVHAGGTE